MDPEHLRGELEIPPGFGHEEKGTGAAAPASKDGRLMAAKAPMGEDGGRAAKRRKVAPSVEQGAGRLKWMRQDDSRERQRLGR